MNDFEDRLRQWGTAQAAAAGEHPPLSVPESRRRWQPLAAAAGVVLLVGGVALAAGSGGDPAPGPVASPQPVADVPWADLPPAVASPTPSVAPSTILFPLPCDPAQLRAEFGSQDAFTGGNGIHFVRLTSTASDPCSLGSAVTAITAVLDGRRVTVPLYRSDLGYGPPKGVLGPGREGYLVLSYNVSCNGTSEQPPNTRSYSAFRMTLGGVVLPVAPGSLDGGVLSFCSDSVATTRAGVDPEPKREADLAVDVLVSVDAPAAVRAGEVLRYVVRVTNTGAVPLDLDPCPNFLQAFGKAVKEPHALNCADAHPVPAHGSETFAMELVVPASTASGATSLFWGFDGSGGGQTTAQVVVERGSDPASEVPECTPDSPQVPCTAGMDVGTRYPYTASTHCGIRELYADGQRWVPREGQPVADGSHNPPPSIDNPYDTGVVVLTKPGVTLDWTSRQGDRYSFRPWTSADLAPEPCD